MKIKKYLFLTLLTVGMMLLLTSCGAKINVETREASNITDTDAYLNGYFDGYDDMPGRVGVYFGKDADNMERIVQDQHPNNVYTSETIDVTYDLNFDAEEVLEPETTYYYAFYATVDGKDILGETKSFTTLATADVEETSITITTGDAKNITDTDATLYAHISTSGDKPDEAGVYLGTSQDDMRVAARDRNPLKNQDVTDFDVWYVLKNDSYITLEPETTYYYQAYVKKGSAVSKGEIKSFTTTAAAEATPDVTAAVE